MKHFVFGGDGLVGQHLVAKLLNAGKEVVVVDHLKSNHAHYRHCEYIAIDIRDEAKVKTIFMGPDDMIYNLAGTLPSPRTRQRDRYDANWPVNHIGARNILRAMDKGDAHRLVQFSTDQVYGRTRPNAQNEDGPKWPIGEFGASNWVAEQECHIWRERGMNISIFRPRTIVNTQQITQFGRLFRLIDLNLPIPVVGFGKGAFQFISVDDCAEACFLAFKANCPNQAFNLASHGDKSVWQVLRGLIDHAGSGSFLLPLPSYAVKKVLGVFELIDRPLMQPEQYLTVYDHTDRSTDRAQSILGFQPTQNDLSLFMAAYDVYRERSTAPYKKAFHLQPAQ